MGGVRGEGLLFCLGGESVSLHIERDGVYFVSSVDEDARCGKRKGSYCAAIWALP